MKRTYRSIGLAAAFALLASSGANGAITSVTTAPTVERVAVARATSVALTWNVATNTPGAVTVSSGSGEFRSPGGSLLGVIQQPLSRTAAGPGSVSISERLLVPGDIVERARRDGYDHILYRRLFTDGASMSGEIKLQIATAKAAAFAITRLALGFAGDGEPLRVVGRGETLRAQAEVSCTGTGLLRGVWEIAGPNPDPDKPAWRVLGEAQTLAAADTIVLSSPALPTEVGGFYLVRLRMLDPETAFEPPVVRYALRQ